MVAKGDLLIVPRTARMGSFGRIRTACAWARPPAACGSFPKTPQPTSGHTKTCPSSEAAQKPQEPFERIQG